MTEVSEDCNIKSCMSAPDFKLTEWWTTALMDVYCWKLADGLSPPPTGQPPTALKKQLIFPNPWAFRLLL